MVVIDPGPDFMDKIFRIYCFKIFPIQVIVLAQKLDASATSNSKHSSFFCSGHT